MDPSDPWPKQVLVGSDFLRFAPPLTNYFSKKLEREQIAYNLLP
jgi:hypothetical protein